MTTTKIKFCGLSRNCDIETANALSPDYVGFVFAKNSRRCVSFAQAKELKALLAPGILTVGVFVNEDPRTVAAFLEAGVIDAAQLHGDEDTDYIRGLKSLTKAPLIKAFGLRSIRDLPAVERSPADLVLLDSREEEPAGSLTGSCWKTFSGPIFWPAVFPRKMSAKPSRGCGPSAWM